MEDIAFGSEASGAMIMVSSSTRILDRLAGLPRYLGKVRYLLVLIYGYL